MQNIKTCRQRLHQRSSGQWQAFGLQETRFHKFANIERSRIVVIRMEFTADLAALCIDTALTASCCDPPGKLGRICCLTAKRSSKHTRSGRFENPSFLCNKVYRPSWENPCLSHPESSRYTSHPIRDFPDNFTKYHNAAVEGQT